MVACTRRRQSTVDVRGPGDGPRPLDCRSLVARCFVSTLAWRRHDGPGAPGCRELWGRRGAGGELAVESAVDDRSRPSVAISPISQASSHSRGWSRPWRPASHVASRVPGPVAADGDTRALMQVSCLVPRSLCSATQGRNKIDASKEQGARGEDAATPRVVLLLLLREAAFTCH
jgi:hypothetical protein